LRVYAELKRVPRGCVITYAALAARVGCRSAQAVGQALRANPFAPEVPCHRVIAADLSPGGFAGNARGAKVTRKMQLLADEGVAFTNGRLAEPSRLLR
jgi:methylated-DNA-[protein]-cysteine S-methyltransferase